MPRLRPPSSEMITLVDLSQDINDLKPRLIVQEGIAGTGVLAVLRGLELCRLER